MWITKASIQTEANQVEALADKHAKKMASTVTSAINITRDNQKVSELQEYVESLNIQAAGDQIGELLQGKGLPPDNKSFYDEFVATVEDAGNMAVSTLPTTLATTATFTVVNPYVTGWINNYTPQLITEINETTRKAIYQTITDGLNQKKHPRTVARDIKEIIGLTENQAKAVVNYRMQLEAGKNLSGIQPAVARRIGLRDQKMIERHFENKYLTAQQIDKMVERYRDSLVRLRSETIARTESFRAMNEGRQLAWEDFVRQGVIEENNIRRFWSTARDDRVRPEHVAIPKMNKEGVGLREPFKTPSGNVMNPPFGVNCRCVSVVRVG